MKVHLRREYPLELGQHHPICWNEWKRDNELSASINLFQLPDYGYMTISFIMFPLESLPLPCDLFIIC